jgi:hypothetical protein
VSGRDASNPGGAPDASDPRRCQAHRTDGEPCRRWAVRGATVCPTHGGSIARVRAAAGRRIQLAAAERAVATYGLPRDINALTALTQELARAQGHVVWLNQLIASGAVELVQTTPASVEIPSVWLDLYAKERSHLAAVARACLSAGVEERTVRLVERQAQMLVQALSAILYELGHDPTDAQVRSIVGRHLRAIVEDNEDNDEDPS